MTIVPIDTSQPFEEFVTDKSPKIKDWLKKLFLHLTLSKKISYGYALAIGISIIGSIIGLAIGDHYEKKAELQLTIAETQENLFQSLNYEVEQMRAHPQQLISVMGNSMWFRYERNDFRNRVYNIDNKLAHLQNFIRNNTDHSVLSIEKFDKLSQDYQLIVDTYTKIIYDTWDHLQPLKISPDQIPQAQAEVLGIITSPNYLKLWVEFEQLSEQLNKIISQAQTQKRAAHQELIKADLLRVQIITSSVILTIIIAILLAIRTSKAISNPLVNATRTAYRVIQEKDFKLQIPVTTKDEIGKVAIALNQLIQWVDEYTKELELAKHNLEEKVEERTEELSMALANLKQTQSKLIQSEKMSSLGKMVAGIAHEINNPISFIYGNLDYIDDYFHSLQELILLYEQVYHHDHEQIKEKIESIELDFIFNDLPKIIGSMQKGSKRIKKIVQSLRNFSHLDESTFKEVDLRIGLDHSLTVLNHRLNRGITITKNYQEIPLINCYPAQLNQVFYHIINNAIDAVETIESPEITITTKQEGEKIMISIKDNGVGILENIKGKLFDPFFTTKPVGQGQGLGLAICYNIIQQHNGEIKFHSVVNGGTEFIITLPLKL